MAAATTASKAITTALTATERAGLKPKAAARARARITLKPLIAVETTTTATLLVTEAETLQQQ